MHYNMLVAEIQRLARIQDQQSAAAPQPPTAATPLPEKIADFAHKKETTNALLRLPWKQLSHEQKQYFGKKTSFEAKQKHFTLATELRAKASALHEKMKAAHTDEERQPLTAQIVAIQEQEKELWKMIDNFTHE
jgi:ABC-type transporter MlaC component